MNGPRFRCLEPLEPRIAPANLIVSNFGKTAKWTDVDGDLVTLTATKGVLDDLDFTFLDQQPGDVGFQLALLDLSDDFAKGTNLTFTARRDPVNRVGDGFVNVGWINASLSDLGTIIVPGDLARLDVGDGDPATTALASITTHSAGALGALTQGATIDGGDPTVDWTVFGRLGAMTVKGDFGANLNILGSQANAAAGSVGAITILGDLFANDAALTGFQDKGAGYLFSAGPMGTVKVAGNVFGGSSTFSGSISSTSSIASVTIGGSMSGGSGDYSGEVFADGLLGSVFIGGTLSSGFERDDNGTRVPSFAAGSIGSGTKIGKVTIMGNVFGGMSYYGGSIYTPEGSFGKIGSVTINGTLFGGTEVVGTGQDATLVFNGIFSDSTIGAVKLGAMQGRNPGSPVNIIAKGVVNPANATEALAISSVTVVRGVFSGQILAGFNSALSPVNPDVQIGAVKVGNNWVGSSIAAGVSQGNDIFFGNGNDVLTGTINPNQDSPAIRSKIASVTITGYAYGSSFDSDSFAIEAQDIGAVKIGGTVLPMTVRSALVGPDDFLLSVTHDFRILEL
jgi:hypothetical protein